MWEPPKGWSIKVEDFGSMAIVKVRKGLMEIHNIDSSPPYYVHLPFFFERWFGVTMEHKLAKAIAKAKAYIAAREAEEAEVSTAVYTAKNWLGGI